MTDEKKPQEPTFNVLCDCMGCQSGGVCTWTPPAPMSEEERVRRSSEYWAHNEEGPDPYAPDRQVMVNGVPKPINEVTAGDIIAEAIFGAIDKFEAEMPKKNVSTAISLIPPDSSMLDPAHSKDMGEGGETLPRTKSTPDWMMPGGPRYPRELCGVSPFPAYGRDTMGVSPLPRMPGDVLPVMPRYDIKATDEEWNLAYFGAPPAPLLSQEEAEKRVRVLFPDMSEEELATMKRLDMNNFKDDGNPVQESFQQVDGKWHAVRPGYNLDGTEVALDWWHYVGIPPGFGPRPHRSALPSGVALFLTDPKMESLKSSIPPLWNGNSSDPWLPMTIETHFPAQSWDGYLPDTFIGNHIEEFVSGKFFTLDMLYAPHPDPFQRMGKKGPASPFDFRLPPYMRLPHHVRAKIEKQFWENALWGNPTREHEIDTRFYMPPVRAIPALLDSAPEDLDEAIRRAEHLYSREGHPRLPVMVVADDHEIDPMLLSALAETERARSPIFSPAFVEEVKAMNTSFAEAIVNIKEGMGAHFKGIADSIKAKYKQDIKRAFAIIRERKRLSHGTRYARPMGSMRNKKARYYAQVHLHLQAVRAVDNAKVEVVEMTELFDHGNGVKTYAGVTGPYGELPQYPKLSAPTEPPFPPPFKVVIKGEKNE